MLPGNSYYTESYNIAAIRRLLYEAFTAEDFRRFCRDRPILRPVMERFHYSAPLAQMVDVVIDYCRTQVLFEELLAEVQAFNPRQYHRYESDLRSQETQEKLSPRPKKYRREDKAASDQYNISAIRELLLYAFHTEELRRFCLDHSKFTPILYNVGRDCSLDEMVDAVVDYCRRHLLFYELLAEVERANPQQYARFDSELRISKPSRPVAQRFSRDAFLEGCLSRAQKWIRPGLVIVSLSIALFILAASIDWSRFGLPWEGISIDWPTIEPLLEDVSRLLDAYWVSIVVLVGVIAALIGLFQARRSLPASIRDLHRGRSRWFADLRAWVSSTLAQAISFCRRQVQVRLASLSRVRLTKQQRRSDIPCLAPRPIANFVGREPEAQRLTQVLEPGAKIAIVGVAGVGKTELAKLATDKVADRFRDGVLWANCGQQDLMLIADLWAAAYGVQLPGDDPQTRTAAWRGLISGKQALLIFDQIQPGQQIELLFPPHGESAMLMTCRDPGHSALRGAEVLHLDRFTHSEAIALTEGILGRRAAREQTADAIRFFDLADHHPLAMSVALHLTEKNKWRLDRLNAELETSGIVLGALGDEPRLYSALHPGLESMWKSLPRDLQETFRALAPFNHGPSFSTNALAETLELVESEAHARLLHLVERSWLSEEGEGRWSLHPLLREFAATRAPLDGATWARMARHYMGMAREADDLYQQGGPHLVRGLFLFDLEWPHISAGQAWSAAHMEDNEEAAQLCSEFPDVAVYCLSLRLPPEEWVKWLEDATRAAHRLGDRITEGKRLSRLGNAYAELGDLRRAIEYHERALTIQREIGDQRAEGDSLSSLGTTFLRMGDPTRAIDYQEQAMITHRTISDRRGEANDLANAGVAYASRGDHEQAIGYYEKALEIYREINNRLGEGDILANLGHVLILLDRAEQAVDCYEQALAIAREIGDRHSEGNWLSGLGVACAAAEEKQQAIMHYQRALAIHREIGDRQGESADLRNLGTSHADLGEMQEAIEFYEQALSIAREIGNRRSEASALEILGNAYADLEDPRRANEYYQQALAVYRASSDLLGEGNTLLSLGDTFVVLQESQRAIEYYEQALTVHRGIRDRHGEANTLESMGQAYALLDMPQRAIEYLSQALVIHREIGDRHGEGMDLANLGSIYASIGEVQQAIGRFEQAANLHRETGDQLGEEAVLANLGAAYASQGMGQQAISYYEQALHVCRQLDARDREAQYWFALGQAYHTLEHRPEAAIEHYEQALTGFQELAERSGEKASLRNLATLHGDAGHIERALDYYQQLVAVHRDSRELDKAAEALVSMGSLARDNGQFERAERFWLESKELYGELKSSLIASVEALLNELQLLRSASFSLEETSRQFFAAADFELEDGDDLRTFFCQPDMKRWGHQLSRQSIPTQVLSGIRLDAEKVRVLCKSAMPASCAKPVVFVIIDREPTEDGWLEIATMRAKGIYVVPIDDVVLLEGQEKLRQRQTLSGHLSRFLGSGQDLYNIRHPVADRLNFFGREVLADELMTHLDKGRPMALFGLRKMGKSSMLKYMRDKLPHPTAIVDLETGTDLQRLYERILLSWTHSVQVKVKGGNWSPPDLTGAADASSAFSAATRQLLDFLKDQGLAPKVCLLVDEMEVTFPRRGESAERYLAFTRTLRGLVQEQDGGFSLLVSSLDPSFNRINRLAGQQNPFYQFFREVYLPALEFDDCMRMICVIGGQMGLKYAEEAARFVAEISGGHPFLARQLCSLAFQELGRDGDVPLSHLEAIAERFIREPGKAELLDEAGLWGEISDLDLWPEPQAMANQAILLSLSQIEPQPEPDLIARAQDHRACERSLDEMEKRDILGRPEAALFHIQLGLFRDWIRRYKLMGSV